MTHLFFEDGGLIVYRKKRELIRETLIRGGSLEYELPLLEARGRPITLANGNVGGRSYGRAINTTSLNSTTPPRCQRFLAHLLSFSTTHHQTTNPNNISTQYITHHTSAIILTTNHKKSKNKKQIFFSKNSATVNAPTKDEKQERIPATCCANFIELTSAQIYCSIDQW